MGVVTHFIRHYHQGRHSRLDTTQVMVALLRLLLGLRLTTSPSLILDISPTTAVATRARG